MNDLVDIALGNKKADLVLKNVNLVNVCSGEIYETDIAIAHDLIAGLGRYDGRLEIDAQDNYAVPGLIDGHTHIEMSMLSVREFAKAVVPRGTTAVVADPHEIANVLGIAGIRALLDDARTTALKVFCTAPSCVPSTDPSLGLETSGATIDHTEIRKLLRMDGIIGLAEVMNYVGVIAKEKEVWEKIEIAKALKMPIDGHAPLLSGKDLNAYVVSGAGSDHENTTYEESQEKLRLGMRVMVREGSVAKNLKKIAPLLRIVDTRNCMLVTDGDRTPLDLKDEGYLDYVLRRAIEEGIDPVKAVQMCTINPAQWFKLDAEIGCIAPGKIADIVLLKNLDTFEVEKVIVNGKPDFAQRSEYSFNYPQYRESVRIMRVKPDEFVIEQEGAIKARIIGLIEGELQTEELVEEISGIEIARDILEIGVLERHHYSGNMGLGFVKGFGLKTGAIASTIAHDTHNIVVIGTNEEDMALACNRLKDIGGGIVLCNGKEVTSELKLPIAGLMSDNGLDYVMRKQKEMDDNISEMGCKLPAPFIAMSFLALPVIPKLKITDRGLVDVAKREIVDIFL
ncbi:MAG: adenine deaminase [Euryarchaeota archaeon]|nr:adenine deaminase [Euryarchaeota archaeon]